MPRRPSLPLLALAALLLLPVAAPASLHAQVDPKVKVKVKPRVKVDVDHRRRDDDDDDEGAARVDTTLALDPRGSVALEILEGDVIVHAWDRPEVRVVASSEDGRITIDATGQRVEVGTSRPGEARYEVTMPRTARLSVSGTSAEIRVDGVHGGVELENANGNVTLADVGGTVRAELMTGELRLTKGDGDFRFELASGDVELHDVAGRVSVESVSGDIEVRGARARELRLETTSGSVTYEGTVAPDGTYELTSHSGDVVLRLPEGTAARLSAETYSGEFESDFPVVMQPASGKVRQRRLELQVGGGQGPLIRIESFSGDIHLQRASAR